MIIFFKLTVFY